jgi:adenosylmethionine-8-amino-7-oxononanoate aminotransferase
METTMRACSPDAIFPRNFRDEYPFAVRGEGVYIFDESGKRYLDACGGSAVVSIGHGVQEIADAISHQAKVLPYVHSSQFHTEVEADLAEFLAGKFPGPPQHVRVHFTSGGSEATETAIKIARQYRLARNEPDRDKLLSRWHGYHGTTLGALAVSGNRKRRRDYQSLLAGVDHVAPCFCEHCWLHKVFPECELACANELDLTIKKWGKHKISAFFLEPVVGATSGAVPAPGYLQEVRRICDANGVLLIADEIMTGVGRTGKYFAVEHWGIVPDLILLGKGLSSGYAPLGAVLVSEKVWRTIADASLSMEHGFTYQAHPPSMAAGLAVQNYLQKHNLLERSGEQGEYLARRLEMLRHHPYIRDVRGKGLLQVVEFAQADAARQPFDPGLKIAGRIFAELRSRGIMVYPGTGTVDGLVGDHILVTPPFIIDNTQIDQVVEQIAKATVTVCSAI